MEDYFSQLLNIHRVNDVRQIETLYTAEPLIPEPSPFEVEISIAMSKRYKTPGSNQIPAEQVQAGGEIIRSEIHKLVNFILNNEEFP
jgi:hypothetical protein